MKKIKKFFEKIRLYFNLDKEIKNEIIFRKFGEPIKLLEKEVDKYCTCPSNAPVEYCSKDNLKETKVFLTDKGIKVKVVELYEGLNFEAPCDKYTYTISKI